MDGLFRNERDTHIEAIVKSNLVSEGLSSEQISRISSEITKDIVDLLYNLESVTIRSFVDYVD